MKPLASRHTFEAIGTHWSVETDTPLSDQELADIHYTIDAFDMAYSRFRTDSIVSRIVEEAPGTFTFPSSIGELYDIYARLAVATDGAVNPLVGKSLEQLGYDRDYSLREQSGEPYIPPAFTDVLQCKDTIITASQPVLLDIGAIGKGYLVDHVARVVAAHHTEYTVDASGDVLVHRGSPETVGLEHPLNPDIIIGTVRLQNQSLCGSAINRRAWGDDLHHVIDARTGRPATTGVVATWAIADSTVIADALATALFFAEPKILQHTFGDFFYVTMYTDGSVSHNIDAVGELYT